MATGRADRPRRFLAFLPTTLFLLAATGAAVPASSPADMVAVWVDLPRAARVEPLDGYAAAPLPGTRALARRAARGDAEAVARFSRGPSLASVQALAGQVRRVRFVSRWLASAAVEVDASQLAALRARYGAEHIHPLRRWARPAPAPVVPLAPGKRGSTDYGPSLKQIQQLQIDAMQEAGFSGRGVRVLMLDTGFFTSLPVFGHLDVVDEYDFVFDDSVTADEPEDVANQHSHGTRVLSVLAGYEPGELIGPAFGAELLLAKTEDLASETQLEEDRYVAGLEWGEALGAEVVSASVGYRSFDGGFTYPSEAFDGDTAVTTRAVDAAAAMGLVCVVAAGNDGPDPMTLLTPADADSALAVGAVDTTGQVRNFSSRGPTFDGRHKPDVSARGWLAVAALPEGGYGLASGTSIAAPLVAGAAALLLEGHPEWTGQQVVEALRATATQHANPDDTIGYGIVQTLDAFQSEPPIVPFPFELLEPADDIVAPGPDVTFRWTSAFDAQSPESVVYGIHFSTSASFEDTVGWWNAGNDTTRTLGFLPTGDFHWRVVATDPEEHVRASEGRSIHLTTSTGHDRALDASWIRFLAPAPNPFNPVVRLGFSLARPAAVSLQVFDLAGRRVLDRPARRFPAGEHQLTWRGIDTTGEPVASGVYLARLQAVDDASPSVTVVHRLSLLR